jgi:hypothetical protein
MIGRAKPRSGSENIGLSQVRQVLSLNLANRLYFALKITSGCDDSGQAFTSILHNSLQHPQHN